MSRLEEIRERHKEPRVLNWDDAAYLISLIDRQAAFRDWLDDRRAESFKCSEDDEYYKGRYDAYDLTLKWLDRAVVLDE